ncbi:MAG: BrnT family toxin [Deltaproteobacteria bacterium]|nr:BrnT family toxin [Deltaproteobacteria bacterium]
MDITYSGFDWDEGNKNKNLKRHTVTCEEAEEVFFGKPLIYPDTRHSSEEEKRYVCFGETGAGKTLFVAFTLRGDRVRVISARPMSQKERSWYVEEKKKHSH